MSVHASTFFFAHCNKCGRNSSNFNSVVRCNSWLRNHYKTKHKEEVPKEELSQGHTVSLGNSIGEH